MNARRHVWNLPGGWVLTLEKDTLQSIVLDLPGIREVTFWAPGRGSAYDRDSGVEFDLRREGRVWVVTDDEERTFRHHRLATAISNAQAAQEG